MASKLFRSPAELQNHMQELCDKAVKNACYRLLGELQRIIIDEFYDVFEPDYYQRSYQFWESAVTKMLQDGIGVVFMDKNAMDYNEHWSGERQLYEANIGSHGGWTTSETKGHRFWNVFKNYCEKNAIKILKEELRKVGFSIK